MGKLTHDPKLSTVQIAGDRMVEGSSMPAWQGYLDDLAGWNVFRATLRQDGIHTTVQLIGSDQGEDAQRAFLEQVTSALQDWLSRSAIYSSSHSVFEVVVAAAPARPRKVAFLASPMRDGCIRIHDVQLVQRVLHELLGVEDTAQIAAKAIYVVDLLEEASGQRFRLHGPAVERVEGRRDVLEAFLQALTARSPDDFPPETGHALRMTYLSDGRVGIAFPERRAPLERGILQGLPGLREVALEDLRRRLQAVS
jgi:hypothetical protein